jgi:hypothetical protein
MFIQGTFSMGWSMFFQVGCSKTATVEDKELYKGNIPLGGGVQLQFWFHGIKIQW